MKEQPDMSKQSVLTKLKKRREEKKWREQEVKEQLAREGNQGVQGGASGGQPNGSG